LLPARGQQPGSPLAQGEIHRSDLPPPSQFDARTPLRWRETHDTRSCSGLREDGEPLMGEVTVEEVRSVLDEAERRLASDLPNLRRRLEEILPLYEGIPSRVEVFDILGLRGDEDRHTEFLAWLLDSGGSHGLGDGFLRRFLALVGDPIARRLAEREGVLTAAVRTQFQLAGGGRPDLVLAVPGSPGVVIVLEAKLGAPVGVAADGRTQTVAYAEWVGRHGLDGIVGSLRVGGRESPGPYEPVFVFLRTKPDQQPEPEGEPKRYRIVEYRSIERALGRLVRDARPPAAAESLIQQFRTSLLAEAFGTTGLLRQLEQLRLYRDFGHRQMPTHIQAALVRTALGPFLSEDDAND
ncbi:MAG: PD-(D/E)XK nuclease family protein, partial [Myxococcota bacterium]